MDRVPASCLTAQEQRNLDALLANIADVTAALAAEDRESSARYMAEFKWETPGLTSPERKKLYDTELRAYLAKK